MLHGVFIGLAIAAWIYLIFKDGFNKDRLYLFILFSGLGLIAWVIS